MISVVDLRCIPLGMDCRMKYRQIMDFLLLAYIRLQRLRDDVAGQDLIEYALMAGFVAMVAAAAMPGVAVKLSTIFSKVNFQMADSAAEPVG